jgi:hypothetical protein
MYIHCQQHEATTKSDNVTLYPYSDFLDDDDDDSTLSHEEEDILSSPHCCEISSETDSGVWSLEESLELFLEDSLQKNDRSELAHLKSHTKTSENPEEEDCDASLAHSLRPTAVLKAGSFVVHTDCNSRYSSVPLTMHERLVR